MYFCFVKPKKTILVAALNWGLGHATRCVPIINALLSQGFDVILASDGEAGMLLSKEFPTLQMIKLPSYQISYPKNGRAYSWHFMKKLPHFNTTAKAEKKIIDNLVLTGQIDGIISDNRFGVFHSSIPSVYVTHQVRVLSGVFTLFSTWFHRRIIKKYNQCWVPDIESENNLSGKLSASNKLKLYYTGILSRMKQHKSKKKYDVLVLLSGPEPQRTMLEKRVLSECKNTTYKILLIQGKISDSPKKKTIHGIEVINFLTSAQLELEINSSEVIVSRSGYSTLMDMAILQKKVFFIPTPGQYEQQYLAKRMEELHIAPFCCQDDFSMKELERLKNYSGFNVYKRKDNLVELIGFFKGK